MGARPTLGTIAVHEKARGNPVLERFDLPVHVVEFLAFGVLHRRRQWDPAG